MPDHTQNAWPPELTHNVLTYLDSDDVARMTRVGNSFQAEAERLLCKRRANWEKSLWKPDMYKCIVDGDPTTTVSLQGRLQELIFWCPDEDALDTLVTDQLCEGLLLMTSLKHLTISLPDVPDLYAIEAINSTLARCTFFLKTLYLSDDLELFPWILNQTELEIFAVYECSSGCIFNRDRHLSCQQRLSSSPCFRNPPIFFILSGDDQEIDAISAFLTFSPRWSAKLIHDSLKRSYANPQNITMFCLYVKTMDELNDENILSVIRSISIHFVNIYSLNLYLRHCKIHLNPEALASVPSSLTGELRELDLEFWERLSKDNELAYFFEWYKLYPCKVWSEERPNTEEDFLD